MHNASRSFVSFVGDQHHAIIATFSSAVMAQLTTNEKLAVFFCCFFGGGVAGLAGSMLSKVISMRTETPELTGMGEKKRWLVNWALAICISPALTQYLHVKYFSGYEIESIALLSSAAVAVLGIPTLCILLPKIFQKKKDGS